MKNLFTTFDIADQKHSLVDGVCSAYVSWRVGETELTDIENISIPDGVSRLLPENALRDFYFQCTKILAHLPVLSIPSYRRRGSEANCVSAFFFHISSSLKAPSAKPSKSRELKRESITQHIKKATAMTHRRQRLTNKRAYRSVGFSGMCSVYKCWEVQEGNAGLLTLMSLLTFLLGDRAGCIQKEFNLKTIKQ